MHKNGGAEWWKFKKFKKLSKHGGPFRIYQLISTANPVKFHSKRAGLAVLISWQILGVHSIYNFALSLRRRLAAVFEQEWDPLDFFPNIISNILFPLRFKNSINNWNKYEKRFIPVHVFSACQDYFSKKKNQNIFFRKMKKICLFPPIFK